MINGLPLVGSSKITNLLSPISAIQHDNFLFIPPLRDMAYSCFFGNNENSNSTLILH